MAEKYGKILIVDDDEDVLQAARLYLKRHVKSIHTEKDPENLPGLLAASSYDVILLDMNFTKDMTGGSEGFYWLEKIRTIFPEQIVIMITAYGDVDTAVKAIKYGATDFVLKPWQNEKLLATISAALQLKISRDKINTLTNINRELQNDSAKPFADFIGESAKMQKVFADIKKVAATDANILILGENGTGKELVARSLHKYSNRSDKSFISVDMGSMNENLFESELFGHEKGAFTDAKSEKIGRFEIAEGGTLFLDEIGNIPLHLQSKILRALESRKISKVGSSKQIDIDIRLITATNENLNDRVASGDFRKDLLYRINTVEITLPPLRERGEDIILLAEHFLNKYSKKYSNSIKGISKRAKDKLMEHAWPGNVRELQNIIERAVILTENELLQPEDFALNEIDDSGNDLSFNSYNLDHVEKTVLIKVLEKHAGNISKAAKELGLTRTSLYRRLEKHGL